MVMFHYHLNSGYEHPGAALRATQLWMLDPTQELPPGIGGSLRGPLSRIDRTAMSNWAAFTYQGS
jgi:hypothetical protein